MITVDLNIQNCTATTPSIYYRYADMSNNEIPTGQRYSNIYEQTSDRDLKYISEIDGIKLDQKIPIHVEKEDGEYIAESVMFPLFGCGETEEEAIEHLKHEILSLYEDLMEDDEFSDEFLRYKDKLKSIIPQEVNG